MSIGFQEARFQLADLIRSGTASVEDLFKLVERTSGAVDGARSGDIYLLQSGTLVDGNHASTASREIVNQSLNIRDIGESPAGKLVDFDQFKNELRNAIAREIGVVSYAAATPEQVAIIDEKWTLYKDGTDLSGKRASSPYSLWDIASRAYVRDNNGSWRIVAGYDVSNRSVLMYTELPELLAKAGDFEIDGVNKSAIAVGDVEVQKSKVLSNAIAQTFLSGAKKDYPGVFAEMTPEKMASMLADESILIDGKTYKARLLEFSSIFSQEVNARYLAGVESARLGMADLSKRLPTKTMARFGLVFGALGFLAAGQASAKAMAEGDQDKSVRIMRDFVVEFAAAEVASKISGSIAAIGVGISAVAGVSVSPPIAGALVLGAALLGGFFGGDAVKDYIEYLNDRDGNGRIDVLDKLRNLVFGADWITTEAPPPNLIARALQLGSHYTALAVDVNYSREDLVANAQRSDAWRYALRELNGFVVEGINYDEYNGDKSLDLFDRIFEFGTMTEEYLKDRAAMLAWLIRYERGIRDDDDPVRDTPKPYNEDWDTNSVEGNWDFVDLKRRIAGGDPLTLAIDGNGISLHDHQVVFGSSKDETIKGEGDDDRLYGGGGKDSISGAAGHDYIEGNAGNDLLNGDAGRDTLRGGDGNDGIYGGADQDLLRGESGADTLSGGASDDIVFGGAGNDSLQGDDGNDALNGGAGADTLFGGTGNDYLFDEGGADTNRLQGEAGNDVLEIKGGTGIALLDGGADNDILIGGQGNNSLDGGTGNDSIKGGGDDDIIKGGDDADFVDAGGGNDDITGGKGADYLKGGAGSDNYIYENDSFGVDMLEDSEGSNRIRIAEKELGAATYDAAKLAWVTADGVEIRKYEMGGSTTLAISKTGDKLNTIYLRDWQPGQYNITLSGSPTDRQRPTVAPATVVSLAENNFVDVIAAASAEGGQGNDLLYGTNLDSLLTGGTGNDILDGEGGDDWLEGGDGTDFILTGAGKDVAYGGLGSDILRAGGTFSMSRGTVQGTGEDAIYWSPTPTGFLFSDDVTSERFYYSVNQARVYVPHPEMAVWNIEFTRKLYQDTDYSSYFWWDNPGLSNASLEPSLDIKLTVGDDREWVERGDNFPAGKGPTAEFGKAKTVLLHYGYGGNMLPAGTGAEGARLYGGEGDDVIYGANDNDRLYGEADDDLLVGYDGDDELRGGDGKDELSGGGGRDFLDGGDKDDTLVGGLGADVLYGGDGADRLIGDAPYLVQVKDYPPGLDKSQMGGDFLQGGAGNDTLWGDHGDDYLFGGTNDDLIFGGEGDDHGFGESGEDSLVGGKGGDYLDGGADKDVILGGEGGDMLFGGGGNDSLDGEEDDDILDGGVGNDTLYGGSGGDNLRGGADSDQLFGDGPETEAGSDILEGGAGNDVLSGGGKGDLYVFSKGDGQDVIHDDGADGSRNVIAFKFSSGDVRKLERSGQDLLIKYGVNDQITVLGYYGGSAYALGSPGSGQGESEGEAQAAVAEIRFEDGTVWGTEQILSMAPAPAPSNEPDPFAGLAPLYFINALLSREETKSSGKHALTFSFADAFKLGVTGFFAFDSSQKQAVRDALARFSSVLDLTFTELGDGQVADLTFHLDDLMSEGMGAFAGYAQPATGGIHLNSRIYSEQVRTEFGEYTKRGSLSVGAAGFETLLHEIGHALGLKHPFEPPVLPDAENTTANTIMSYTSAGIPATQLAAFDIAALQYLYGANKGTKSSNDSIFSFGDRWIVDASGSGDRFDASSEGGNVFVDLTPGSWIYRGQKSASMLADGQAFIAFGTQIENAVGGIGNDTLKGNDAANRLDGGAGDDYLDGGANNDRLWGGAGNDTLAGGGGSDEVYGNGGADTYLWGQGQGSDVLGEVGDGSINVLALTNLSPQDVLLTKVNQDLIVRAIATGETIKVVEHFSGQGVQQILFQDGKRWDLETITANLSITTTGPDYFQGTGAAEFVNGLAGNDTLNGGGGNDYLSGADGADIVSGEDGDDTLSGGTGNDYVEGGAGNDQLSGDEGSDTLAGGAGDDVIVGGGGDDKLIDGRGHDIYVFGRGHGADSMDFYPGEGDSTTLRMLPGVTADDLLYKAENGDDLKIVIAGTTDSFLLRGFVSRTADATTLASFNVQFADGSSRTGAEVLARLFAGTSGDDYLRAQPSGSSISGAAGADSLQGLDGNDTLDGGSGRDTLRGYGGNDVLVNGEDMYGGTGNDTFIVDAWPTAGTTTLIADDAGIDSLLLPTGATPSNVRIRNQLNGDLWIALTSDAGWTRPIIVTGYFAAANIDSVESIRFRDGTSWSRADVIDRTPVRNLTEGDDANVIGFAWNDTISALGGNDTISAGSGDDFVEAGSGSDYVYGGNGHDTLIGGDGSDVIYGDDTNLLPGNDLLDGGAGNDTLYGGSGDDIYVFGPQSGSDLIVENAGSDRISVVGGVLPSSMQLYSDGGDLVLVINNSRTQLRVSQYFSGAANSQKIEAITFMDGTSWDQAYIGSHVQGPGNVDTLVGGTGNDIFNIDNPGDTIVEGANQGVDTAVSSVSYFLPANVENLTLTGVLALSGYGNDLTNMIVGNAGDNQIKSYGGWDTLRGGGGDDYYDITVSSFATTQKTPSSVTIIESAGEGDDTVLVNTNDYSMQENIENLVLRNAWYQFENSYTKEQVRDSFAGNSQANFIDASALTHWVRLDGGAGADRIIGGQTNNLFVVDQAGDSLVSTHASAIDTVETAISWSLSDGFENVTLVGNSPIEANGNALSNVLDGSANTAANNLRGGLGDDTYILGVGDSITELANEGVDKVVLSTGVRGAYEISNYENIEKISLAYNMGQSTLRGAAADDTIEGNGRGVVLYGGSGGDVLVDQAAKDTSGGSRYEDVVDTLIGGDGNDTLISRGGGDELIGGLGNDIYQVNSYSAFYDPVAATIKFGQGDGKDRVTGGRGANLFFTGWTLSDLNARAVGDGFILSFGNGSDEIAFDSRSPSYQLIFEDGTLINQAAISLLIASGGRGPGADGSDLLIGTNAADSLAGMGGDDTIYAGAGDDSVDAGVGQDVVNGGMGNDTILGGAGGDTLRGDAGDDVIDVGAGSGNVAYGGDGDDTLRGGDDADYLYGEAGADELHGGLGNDYLFGGDGEDRLFGEGGYDSLSGGLGNDRLSASGSLDGGDGNDSLFGLQGNDSLTGGDGQDLLEGGEGSDTLKGGYGSDVLRGGAGNDLLSGNEGDDIYLFGRGDGVDSVAGIWSDGTDEIRFDIGIRPADIELSRSQIGDIKFSITGATDSLVVNSLMMSSIVALVRFADGTVWTRSEIFERLNTIRGTEGADSLTGSSDDDRLFGMGGNDTLTGDSGMDTLDGGAGVDSLVGGSGDDVYLVDDPADIVVELFSNEGFDRVESSATFTLPNYVEDLTLIGTAPINGTGNSLQNNLSGNDANNSLSGGAGNDWLYGFGGDDSLNGGTGGDFMQGGLGNDVYTVDSVLVLNANGEWVSGDQVRELEGEGTDAVLSSVSYQLSDYVENLTLTGSSGLTGTGNSLSNSLRGNGAGNRLEGRGGNDTIDGGAGADSMLGGAGDDLYYVDATTDVVTELAGEGVDTVVSSVTLAALASNVENLTLAGTSALNGAGNGLDNLLTGNSGANRLDGGTGADTLVGGGGNDVYVVDQVGDVITEIAGGGTDTVESSISYVLAPELENLTLLGSTAINGTGNSVANTLTGNSGANRLDGGAGVDSMIGGAGNDTYVVDVAGDTVTESSGGGTDTVESSVTYSLSVEVENLTLVGTSDINATGNSAANVLRGNAGRNTLNGGAGVDTMIGGVGDDIYVLDVATDVVTENAGEGTDTIQIGVTLATLAANVENVTLTGTSNINATGNALANVLTGNSGANNLSGGDGDDTLIGGAGADTMVGGLGNDVFYVDATTDVVTEASGQGTDTIMSSVTLTVALASNVENVTLTGTSNLNALGNALANVMTGNSGANNLSGGDGDDTLDGGAGIDTLVGGLGNDVFYVDSTSDVVTEASGQGTDTIMTSVTLASLAANVENLTLTGTGNINGTGSSGDNVMTGNAGNNTLTGAAGNDTLDGKAGNDTLNGGAGADTYWFGLGYGFDLIVDSDATANVKDVVRFTAGIAQSDIRFTQSGNALVATIKSTNEALTIQDWYLSANNRVEEFRFNDGTVLTNVQAQALVGAMAAFNPSGGVIAMVQEPEPHLRQHTGLAVSGTA
ncbi:calcium-binding protein [Roseateles sp. DXS20W]|uniref:Calcium-binding protein n=1 Tax=Pelomonas lactea TaxID=3299030 RepID=A0ABW7GDT3_9BURK